MHTMANSEVRIVNGFPSILTFLHQLGQFYAPMMAMNTKGIKIPEIVIIKKFLFENHLFSNLRIREIPGGHDALTMSDWQQLNWDPTIVRTMEFRPRVVKGRFT